MINVAITKEIIEYAEKKLNKIQSNSNIGLSKFGSEKHRILVGYIGEKIIMNYLSLKEDVDDFNFDLLSKKNKRLEVKTITCKFKPKEDYWCTVNSHDLNGVHKQNADYYVFLRIMNDFSKGWILGWISCDEFFEKGTFVSKGTDFDKFKFEKANATILPIKELNKF
jgi:hypothetical protein